MVNRKEEKYIKDKCVAIQGEIVDVLPSALEYKVQIDFKGLKHTIVCTMSGRMKRNFIKVEKGDRVDVKVSLYNIDRGVILYVYRNKGFVEAAISPSTEATAV